MNNHALPSANIPFADPASIPGELPSAVTAALFGSVGDVAIVLDSDGTVVDVALSEAELAQHGFADWVGLDWVETVSHDSRSKIPEMLADARTPGTVPRWRQINHPTSGPDIPVRYLVMALGDSGRMIAIGRDMRSVAVMQQRLLQTQQSLERDYLRLRQAETRYRLLFDSASEAVLMVDPGARRIREANPAAHRLVGAAEGSLVEKPVTTIVAEADREPLIAHLGAAEAADDIPPVVLRLADREGEVRVSARLFRQSRAPLLLVRLSGAEREAADRHRHDAALGDVVERMPDAFVLADRDLHVLTANAAFLELAELPSSDRAVGVPLGQWIGRPGIDLDLIVAQLREHGAVRNVGTILRGAAGAQEEIEVSAVAAPVGDGDCYGFTIRNVGRRLRDAGTPLSLPRSIEQLTELVGRMSLKEIVRESTDLIERLCIEAALAYTADNRASAAEILGLSRQSLYTKLHRHGLGNLVSGEY